MIKKNIFGFASVLALKIKEVILPNASFEEEKNFQPKRLKTSFEFIYLRKVVFYRFLFLWQWCLFFPLIFFSLLTIVNVQAISNISYDKTPYFFKANISTVDIFPPGEGIGSINF